MAGGVIAAWAAQSELCSPKPIRELRDLTRYRKTLVQERSQEVNRLQKLLEGANIKLAAAGNAMWFGQEWTRYAPGGDSVESRRQKC